MTSADNAGLPNPADSPALIDFLARQGIVPDSADPVPVESAQDADHQFPDEPPGELLYNRGCRCVPCTACHTDEARRRYHEHKDGTFVDRRKRTPPSSDPLAATIAALDEQSPELAAMLRKHLQAADGIVFQDTASGPERHRAGRTPALDPPPGYPRLRQAASLPSTDDWWAQRVRVR